MGRNPVGRIVAAAALVTVLMASLPTPPAIGGRVRRVGQIAPGVVHRVIRQPKVPRVIHVVIADVTGPASLKVALSNGVLPGLERTSSIARRHGAIAAINGDFFRPSGRPVAAFATGGELVQTPLVWAANLALGAGGRSAFMGHSPVAVRLESQLTGDQLRVAKVNEGRPRRERIALYTPHGGRLVRPPRNACAARLQRAGTNRFDVDAAAVVAPFTVRAVRCRRPRMPFNGGIVVAAQRWGKGRDAIRELRDDGVQKLVWTLGWPNVGETIGGNPVLVKDGELAWSNLRSGHALFNRHPRTGVGIRSDGRVMLVTVDGRRPKRSKGMTMLAFARLMRSLGAQWALNLDGGGSTTMVVRGAVVNRPSDGRERAVGSALLVMNGDAARRSTATATTTLTRDTSVAADRGSLPVIGAGALDQSSVVRTAAELDPASIGGLSSWLHSDDRALPPSLTALARRFDRSHP